MADTFSFHPPALSPGQYEPIGVNYSNRSAAHAQQRAPSPPRLNSSGGGHFAFTVPSPNDNEDDEPPRATTSHGVGSSSFGEERHQDYDPRRPSTGAGAGGPPRRIDGAFSRSTSPPLHPLQQYQQPPPQHHHQHPPPSLSSYHSAFPPPSFASGVNMRNTRPMTAPSSVSAPYYQGAHYGSSPGVPVSTSFYHPQQYHPSSITSRGGGGGGSSSGVFQYQIDSTTDTGDGYRSRNFSLPDISPEIGSVGMDEMGRFSSTEGSPGGNSTFFYGPPPINVRPPVSYPSHHSAQHFNSSPEQSDPYSSRPTTGDSRTTSSSHTTVTGPPSQFSRPPPLYGPTPIYPPGTINIPEAEMNGARPAMSGDNTKVYNFIAQAGQTSKRPRRRYDQIERLYNCDYPGCQKAYGTLNHLNSHKTMQKHGPRSTPAEFKERRKAWREGKKAAAAVNSVSSSSTKRARTNSSAARVGGRAGGAEDDMDEDEEKDSFPTRHERQRPSTSAGEYHYNLPTPFMSSVGTPMANYPVLSSSAGGANPGEIYQPLDTISPPTTTNASSWFSPPAQPVYEHSYHHSVRPFTAPSHYSSAAPSFGYSSTIAEEVETVGGGPTPARLGLPLPITSSNPVMSGYQTERRLSLPGSQFGYSLDEGFSTISEEGLMYQQPGTGLTEEDLLNHQRSTSANSSASSRR